MERVPTDRRTPHPPPHASAADLVDAHVSAARSQLAVARDDLTDARRRVVQLEEAVANWVEFSRAVALRSSPTN